MSRLYSAMVRSEEKKPERAVFKIDIVVHLSRSEKAPCTAF